jgi:hypothetical protein
MKKVVTAGVIAVALAYIFDNTYQRVLFNREFVDEYKNAESAGQEVRNRLQGSDVDPQDDMLSTPSIYRDWVRVQKGYQSLRMMNDNDNFNSEAEEAHFNIYEESFAGEWHYFSECETKGCDGSIEYRDVYACPSCGQDDVEILMGDTCPDCGVVAEDVSKYAIFYCSDCEEDYTDMYNSEAGVCNCGSSCNCDCGCAESGVCNCGPSCPCNCGCGIGAESFNAHVYRGKPMTELSYSGRAMATKKMMESADIEQSILQLEVAIRMGLISEDEIIAKLRDTFGPK